MLRMLHDCQCFNRFNIQFSFKHSNVLRSLNCLFFNMIINSTTINEININISMRMNEYIDIFENIIALLVVDDGYKS